MEENTTDRKRLIWSDIPKGVALGHGVKIGKQCHIDPNIAIGSYTNIQGGVYICPKVIIGRECFIGPCVVFTNDLYPPSDRLVNTIIGDGVIIGANCTIRAGVKLGDGCIIGQMSNVLTDIPRQMVAYGNPAKIRMTRPVYEDKQKRYEKVSRWS